MTTRRRRPTDVLMLLERAYDLFTPEDHWLRSISDAALPLMNDGFGTFAWKVDLKTRRIVSFVTSGAPGWLPELVRGIHDAASAAEQATASRGRYTTLSKNFGSKRWLELDITKRHVLPYGVSDAVSINTIDAERRFLVVVGAPLRKVITPSDAEVLRWGRVASHVAAACRLRERLTARPAEAEGEAVLSPSGGLDHAAGKAATRSARDVLREAVLQRERALGSARTADPGRALNLWRGLVEGRWSLVDRFEADGRRYVVAHANEMNAPGPRALTPQERSIVAMAAQGQPLKLIAYDLGLSATTVSACLNAGMRKIGVRSRAELVRVSATLRHQAEDEG